VGCIVERRNDEFYAEYLQVKEEKLNEGMSERKPNREAIEIAATATVTAKLVHTRLLRYAGLKRPVNGPAPKPYA
jgi:hypothetical protein